MIALGTPLVLLGGQLGASSFEIGIMYAFVFLLLPVQILATSTLPRFGYKKQIIFGWITRGLFLLIPLYLTFLAPQHPERWMVNALILSTFGFSLFRTFGSCAIMPLLYASLPENVRGKYFSTDQAVLAISGILTMLATALLFRLLPVYNAFFCQYAYSILAVAMTLFYLAKIKDPPKPKAKNLSEILEETPNVCLRPSPFRQALIFKAINALMGTSIVPLTAYYLKTEGAVSIQTILVFTSCQYVGAIIGTILIRNRIDSTGVKPVLRISLLTGAIVSLFWFLLITHPNLNHNLNLNLHHFLPLAFLLFGLSSSFWVTANLKYLPRVCNEEKQALHVSVQMSVIGIIGGIAPIIWGFVVKLPSGAPGILVDRFAVYFALLAIVQLALYFYVPRLSSKHRERPAILLSGSILRPFRYIGQLVNVVEEPSRQAKRDIESEHKGL